MNDLTLASVLGVVEGLTEYLPVSSTGHLIVFGSLFGFTGERADVFEIFIQTGAIFAVLVLYWKRFVNLIPKSDEKLSPKLLLHLAGFGGWSGIIKLAAGCLPAFIGGFLLHHYIKEHLFSTSVVAYSLITGGVFLLLFPEERMPKRTFTIDQISVFDAFKVGCFQLLALCPGVSRSASTIVGGMLCGMKKEVAAEFSFFLAVPTLFAAAGFSLFKSYKFLHAADIAFFTVGTVVSFFTAMIAIRTFLGLLQKFSLRPWGVYRILAGAVILYYFS